VTFGKNSQEVVNRLLANAPTDDLTSRLAGKVDESWKQTAFNLHKTKDSTIFTLPNNIETFADSLLMASILRFMHSMGYTFALSSQKVTSFKGDRSLESFISGYLLELTHPSSEMPTGVTQFQKGRRACVLENYKPQVADAGVMFKKPNMTLGQAIGRINCSQESWSARQRLTTIFRSVRYERRIDETELLQPKQKLKEVFKITLPFKDKMVFTQPELAAIEERYKDTLSHYDAFLNDLPLNSPWDMWQEYNGIKKNLKDAIKRFKELHNMRSAKLFPQGTKKTLVNYRRLPLEEKIAIMRPVEYCRLFDPSKVFPDKLAGRISIPARDDEVLLGGSNFRKTAKAAAEKYEREIAKLSTLVNTYLRTAENLGMQHCDEAVVRRFTESDPNYADLNVIYENPEDET
jgi:hypothetical protein